MVGQLFPLHPAGYASRSQHWLCIGIPRESWKRTMCSRELTSKVITDNHLPKQEWLGGSQEMCFCRLKRSCCKWRCRLHYLPQVCLVLKNLVSKVDVQVKLFPLNHILPLFTERGEGGRAGLSSGITKNEVTIDITYYNEVE